MTMPSIGTRPALPGWQADTRHAVWPAVMVWLLLVLMTVPDGLAYDTLDLGIAPESGSAVSRLAWLGLGAGAAGMLVWRSRLAVALAARVNPALWLFLLLALLSLAWSIDPGLSARRLYRLATVVMVCVALGLAGWQAHRFQQVLRPALTLLLAGSLLFGLLRPDLAVHAQTAAELAGAWRGLASHKNGLGSLAGLGLLLWLHAGLTRQTRVLPALAGGALALACLLLSRSSTALVAMLVAACWLVLARHWPRSGRGALALGVAVATAALLLAALGLIDVLPGASWLGSPIAAITGKDESLTGRTGIWALVVEHAQRRPLLGAGFGAYWVPSPGDGNEAGEIVRQLQGFYPASAHNGYLDVLHDLGWSGLLLLLAYLSLHVRDSLRLRRDEPSQADLYLAVFFQQAIGNLSETHWFAVQSVDLVVMTLASVALGRSLLALRLAQRVPAMRPSAGT
ncbi:O-antigen ligase family protein [Leptothrix discophora]|uniref:O-antigen ligase family protein n=1 Tax=Leptothrix discophora TaxID=89 RepID=A0ABT9G8L6_LEPDI|nr:O-antigen ligase family protein [Leptothrix discophora]MDP4302815.1 O-antigen ligase family protein [Leptothrix discophora]